MITTCALSPRQNYSTYGFSPLTSPRSTTEDAATANFDENTSAAIAEGLRAKGNATGNARIRTTYSPKRVGMNERKVATRLNDRQSDALAHMLELSMVDLGSGIDCDIDIIHPDGLLKKKTVPEEELKKSEAKASGGTGEAAEKKPKTPTRKTNYGSQDAESAQQLKNAIGEKAALKILKAQSLVSAATANSKKGAESEHPQGPSAVLETQHEHIVHAAMPKQEAQTCMAALKSGMVIFFMMFGFCCAFGMILFNDESHAQHRALGVRMNLLTAGFLGGLLAARSRIPIAIGGPEMNVVLFLADFVDEISTFLRDDLISKGMTKAGTDQEWCMGAHLVAYTAQCADYHERLRATTVFTVALSSVLLATVFSLMGCLKITRYISFVPTSIIDAFLSCMGWKVFRYGLKLCKYDPQIFIPSAAVGVPLYFMKAHQLGNLALMTPIFMTVPSLIMYVVVYAGGSNLEEARKTTFSSEITDEGFWTLWTEGLYNYQAIEFKTLSVTWPNLGVMLLVCTLDCLVSALRTSEAKLPIRLSMDYETSLFGIGNFVMGLGGACGGYMQLNFNLLNHGVMKNVKDRRAGFFSAFACFVAFCAPLNIINYMPRLFFGTLMFFGGSGFVAEHLWGSREYLSALEWVQVFIILGIFIIWDILPAVLAGFVLCGITFIAKYAKIPCVAGTPLQGGELSSREQHSSLVETALRHLLNKWLLVVRLKGFIFFASVQSITLDIRRAMGDEEQMGDEKYKHLHFVLLDCELLDGLDSSAEKDLQQLAKDLRQKGVRVLWSAVDKQQVEGMVQRGTIYQLKDSFSDMDSAMLYIESIALTFRRQHQKKWAQLHPAFELWSHMSKMRESFEPFSEILSLDIERFGVPWQFASRITMWKHKTLLWSPNEYNRELFLVHTGAVGLFDQIPMKDGRGKIGSPVAVYRHGWFLNREATMRAPTRYYALALEDGEVLYWSNHDWCRMQREKPLMASAMVEAAMRQSNSDMERMITHLKSVQIHDTVPDIADAQKEIDTAAGQQYSWSARISNMAVKRSINNKAHSRMMEEEQHTPSENLGQRLEGIIAAMHLENFGLYDRLPADENGALPDLPRLIQHDLEAAFLTYSVVENGVRGVPWDNIPKALMYAGIFGAMLIEQHRIPIANEEQFITIGHEAAFMRLSKKMVVKLYNHLGKSVIKDGCLVARDSLIGELRKELLPSISEQEVNGIANTWEDDGSGMISVSEFIGIVSRFVRRHEQDWNLLRGIRDVLHKSVVENEPLSCHQSQHLTPDKLSAWSRYRHGLRHGLTDYYAREMLWASSCHANAGTPPPEDSLDWAGIAAAVLVHVDQPRGKLPPGPKTNEEVYGSGDTTHRTHARTLRMSLKEEMSAISDEKKNSTEFEEEIIHAVHDHHKSAEHKRWLSMPVPQHTQILGVVPGTPQQGPQAGQGRRKSKSPRSPRPNDDLDEDGTSSMDIPAKKFGAAKKKPGVRAGGLASKGSPEPKKQEMVPIQNTRAQTFAFNRPYTPVSKEQAMKLTKGELGKARFYSAARHIVDAAVEEAFQSLGLLEECSPLQNCVLDLRSKSSKSADVGQLQRTRVSYIDFEQERNKRHIKSLQRPLAMATRIPDTPDAKIYMLLEDANSSFGAKVLSIFIGICIIGSVFTLFIRALVSPEADDELHPTERHAWLVVEVVFTVVFFSEYILRLAVCEALSDQTTLFFISRPLNICDVVSILPFFLEAIFVNNKRVQMLRLARVARLARLSSRSAIFGPIAMVFTIVWGIYLKKMADK